MLYGTILANEETELYFFNWYNLTDPIKHMSSVFIDNT